MKDLVAASAKMYSGASDGSFLPIRIAFFALAKNGAQGSLVGLSWGWCGTATTSNGGEASRTCRITSSGIVLKILSGFVRWLVSLGTGFFCPKTCVIIPRRTRVGVV